MECIILIGIPGSGKTTLYQKSFMDTHHRLNLDSLGRRSRERIIFEACIKSKAKIVIDNTNVTIDNRKKYIPLLKKNNYKIIACYILPSLKLSIERNNKRNRKIPEEAIEMYTKKLIPPTIKEGFDEIYHFNMDNELTWVEKYG